MLKRRKKQLSENGNTPPRLAELVTDPDLVDPVRLAFVSDLHLFSSRCHYERHEATIRRAVEASDVCVWGGDLFDFCWSRLGGGDVSRRAAIDWLEAWRSEFPEKIFVYLSGNHDAQASFRDSLEEWARPHFQSDDFQSSDPHQGDQNAAVPAQHIRLRMRPGAVHVGWDAIRLADTLMVHGDVIEGGRYPAGLDQYRNRWAHEPATSPANLQNGLYDAAVTARLHLAAAGVVHRRRSTCLRLLHWARQQPHWLHHDIQRMVFGHTHRCLSGVHVAGIDFYNGGAAVKHVKFEPVVLSVADHE
ncbi:MAG: metallophosphoesterase [Rhodopirellula bahusiensis]